MFKHITQALPLNLPISLLYNIKHRIYQAGKTTVMIYSKKYKYSNFPKAKWLICVWSRPKSNLSAIQLRIRSYAHIQKLPPEDALHQLWLWNASVSRVSQVLTDCITLKFGSIFWNRYVEQKMEELNTASSEAWILIGVLGREEELSQIHNPCTWQ